MRQAAASRPRHQVGELRVELLELKRLPAHGGDVPPHPIHDVSRYCVRDPAVVDLPTVEAAVRVPHRRHARQIVLQVAYELIAITLRKHPVDGDDSHPSSHPLDLRRDVPHEHRSRV